MKDISSQLTFCIRKILKCRFFSNIMYKLVLHRAHLIVRLYRICKSFTNSSNVEDMMEKDIKCKKSLNKDKRIVHKTLHVKLMIKQH